MRREILIQSLKDEKKNPKGELQIKGGHTKCQP